MDGSLDCVPLGQALNKRWSLSPSVPQDVMLALKDYAPIEREILFHRGIQTIEGAESYLTGVNSDLNDPFLLKGMDKATTRLAKALKANEQIVVYGDYDADGVTSTALLVEVFRGLGGIVRHYIPSRFDEGYGLNLKSLSELKKQGVHLIVTVDCGIRAISEVEYANKLGLDMILTDHHLPGAQLPSALAVINPKQPGDNYPFKSLSGVGLAYKLAQALCQSMKQPSPDESLDLVAIGTVADLSPLEGENRILVRIGLEKLNGTTRKGIEALCEIGGFDLGSISTTTIGFSIGPRLNAAGRLGSAKPAFELLLEREATEARRLALELDEINRERQKITREMVEQARSQYIEDGIPSEFIFVVDSGFNEGVVGLAASRLVDEFYRPSVVAAMGKELTRASGRSIPEFHITNALDECADLLERYGGHSAAAGFSVLNENLGELRQRLQDLANEHLSDRSLRPTLNIDSVVQFSELNWTLLDFIEQMEPSGMGNPMPVLVAEGVSVLRKRVVGRERNHLKLTLGQGGATFDAIAFRQGHLDAKLPPSVDLAFHLERNEYWNVPSLELNVLDIRPAGSLNDPELTVRNESPINP